MNVLDALIVVHDLAGGNVLEEADALEGSLKEEREKQLDAIRVVNILIGVLSKDVPVLLDTRLKEPDLFLAKPGKEGFCPDNDWDSIT